MLRKLFIILLSLPVFNLSFGQDCPNIGFENGDFGNWSGMHGSMDAYTYGSSPYWIDNMIQGGINSGAGPDVNTCNTLPVLAPGGGNFSATVGNYDIEDYGPGTWVWYGAALIKYDLTVSPQNALLIYQYAPVLQNPYGHTHAEMPRFEFHIWDQFQNDIDPACGVYIVYGDNAGAQGFDSCYSTTWSSYVLYKDWTTVGVDLTPYMGQTITLVFMALDCGQGGHFGYAYVDAQCAPLFISSSYCVGGNSAVLTAPSGFSYLWNPGGQTTQSITIANPIPGSHYDCTLTSVNGCQVVLNTSLKPYSVEASFDTTQVCTTVDFTDNSVSDTLIGSWHWDFGDGATSDLQNPQHIYAPGTYTVTLTTTTVNGCFDDTTITINVGASFIDAGPDVSLCPGESTILTATGLGTYTWSTLETTASITVNPATTTTYTVTANNAGCTSQDDVVVTINTPPIANAGTDQIICFGQNANLTATGGGSYLWDNLASTQSINVSPVITTTYFVTVTDANSCTDSDDVMITVNPIIPADAGPDTAICIGNSVTLNASSGTTYIWSASPELSATNIQNPIVNNPLATNTYSVTITDANGCSDDDDVTVTVNPLPTANAGPDQSICDGESATLNASGGYAYIWSPNTFLTDDDIYNPISTPSSTITYFLSVTDINGCTGVDDIIITVNPMPLVAFIPDTLSGCEPLMVNFVDLSTPTIAGWEWDFGDASSGTDNFSNDQNPAHNYENAGSYSVSLTVVTNQGCEASLYEPLLINVYEIPSANFEFTPPSGTLIFNSTFSFTDLSTDAALWNWNFGDPTSNNLNYSSVQNPSHTYSAIGTYTVYLFIETQHGCTDSVSKTLEIEDEFTFYAPNAFTPEGDGLNEYWIPQGTGWDLNTFQMYIFDRWGNMVYESSDVTKPWDGRANGGDNVAQIDVYSWLVTLNDTRKNSYRFLGRVTLVK